MLKKLMLPTEDNYKHYVMYMDKHYTKVHFVKLISHLSESAIVILCQVNCIAFILSIVATNTSQYSIYQTLFHSMLTVFLYYTKSISTISVIMRCV